MLSMQLWVVERERQTSFLWHYVVNTYWPGWNPLNVLYSGPSPPPPTVSPSPPSPHQPCWGGGGVVRLCQEIQTLESQAWIHAERREHRDQLLPDDDQQLRGSQPLFQEHEKVEACPAKVVGRGAEKGHLGNNCSSTNASFAATWLGNFQLCRTNCWWGPKIFADIREMSRGRFLWLLLMFSVQCLLAPNFYNAWHKCNQFSMKFCVGLLQYNFAAFF